MSRSKEHWIKEVHEKTAAWLEELTRPQVIALAYQHKIESVKTQSVEQLRTALVLLPTIHKLVETPHGNETIRATQ